MVASVVLAATISVYPSGGERTTAIEPVTELAPGRFSTTNDFPYSRSSLPPISRARMLYMPPGADGATMVTVRVG